MRHIAICAGGPEAYIPDFSSLEKNNLIWIGVDGGTIRLLENGIIPEMAIGDFDSVNSEELSCIKEKVRDFRKYPAEKDLTDVEIALKTVFSEFDPEEVSVYGATGGRMDHLLSNIMLVFRPEFKADLTKIHLYDRQNSLSFYRPGAYVLNKEPDKYYLAFIGLTPVKDLSLKQVKYPLDKACYEYPIAQISNEFINSHAYFSFEKGLIAVIQTKDLDQ